MVLSGIRPSFPSLSRSAGQITHVLLTRSPLEHPHHKSNAGLSVRLACVKHAASVRPEPGSNSPKKQKNYRQKTKKSTKQKQTTTANTKKPIDAHIHVHVQTIKFVSSNDTLSSSQTTLAYSHFQSVKSRKRKATLVSLANMPKACQLRWSSAWRPPR